MSKKVIVLGGGVAGMSAAHELIERGFRVEVYEKRNDYCGGKARSVNVPHSNLQHPDKFLPGEHGFRFFPGFYKHITDTMKRIPFSKNGVENKNGVFDNLVATDRIEMARYGKTPIVMLANFPKSIDELRVELNATHAGTGLTDAEKETFIKKVWQLMTSCYERRLNDYERIGWWEFMEADNYSDTYRHLLVEGLTRTLVAANAHYASTKTGGDIFLQLIFNMADPFQATDRVLNGPTNDVWLDPWLNYLKKSGVQYHMGFAVKELQFYKGKITAAVVVDSSGKELVVGDEDTYFVLATPVEVAAELITPDMKAYDASLACIDKLAESVAWMNGIQYYLNVDVPITHGHCIYSDSQWAVTSISQVQFWDGYDLSARYDGSVKGILSVDISDWETAGLNGKKAMDCTPKEIKEEVWAQMKTSLNVDGNDILTDDMLVTWHMDCDIVEKSQEEQKKGEEIEKLHTVVEGLHAMADKIDQSIPHKDGAHSTSQKPENSHIETNTEPLLVNTVNSWGLRPEAYSRVSNLFLASDYVRTYTDLATMEGANEAARRAVNCIIDVSGSDAEKCKIWNLHEPKLLEPLRHHDSRRYAKGLPYEIHMTWLMKVLLAILKFIMAIVKFFTPKKKQK